MEEQNNCKCCGFFKNHGGHKMVKIVLVVIVVLIIGRILFGNHGYNRNDLQKDTIVVSGKGELTVKPDIATISFSTTAEDLDVSKASDLVNKYMADIVSNLKLNGVDDKDIKTTNYNIYPRYDYLNAQVYPYSGKQVLVAYVVTQSINLKIRDLSKAGKIISDLGSLKVTDMSGLTFTNDKYDDLVKQARDEAIVQARDEAKKLAKSLGVILVKIVGYSEGGNYPVYYDRAMVSSAPMGKGAEAVLPTGENKITSNVSITYEIR
ncbi:MAG: SIMPL domain-containing protein [Candidatus Taylorbacteria bacterium]|nr:SIMPL domain-containing protein [Candidatus Taylorbacteria bacterium]